MSQYKHSEANWGPVLSEEVPQGSHVTFEVPLRFENKLIALQLRHGIHNSDPTKLYFPHGLIRFGELVPACVERLVHEIAGVNVTSLHHTFVETWLDDSEHFHICCTVLATIASLPKRAGDILDVLPFDQSKIPSNLAWWNVTDVANLFEKHWL